MRKMFPSLSSNSRMAYLFQEAALIVGLSFLVLLNGSTNGLTDPALQKGLALIITLAALAWVAVGQWASPPAWKAVLVWVGLYLLAVIFSVDPRRSLTQMELMGIDLFLLLLSADLVARGWPRELLVKALLIVGSLVTAVSWLSAGLWYMNWLRAAPGQWLPDILYRPGSANVVAMFMNLMVMLAGARLLVTRGWGARLALAVLAAAAAGMLYLTSSRGGWLGAAAGLAALAALAVITGRVDVRRAWEFMRARPVLLVAAGAALAAGMVLVGGFLYQRTIHPTHAPVSTARSEYWPPAWQAFLAHPLTGTGPFTYSEAFLGANSVPPRFLYIHAHGTPFNLLAEMGLAGAVGGLLLAGSVVAGLLRRLRETQSALEDLGVVMGAAAALAAVAVHSLFDGFHTEPVGLWVLVTALGAALGRFQSERDEAKQRDAAKLRGAVEQRGAFGLRIANIWSLPLAGLLWMEIWTAAPLHQGTALANETRWQEAAAAFDQAVARDPASVIAHQQRGLAYAVLAGQGQPGALEQAAAEFETVTRLEPAWAMNHANLGALYYSQERLPEARAALEESLRRAPGCALCALNLGVVQEAQGDGASIDSYWLALTHGMAPDAYFWRSTPTRQLAWRSWSAERQQSAGQSKEAVPTLAELEARRAADPSSLRPYLELADALIEAGRPDEANMMLERAGLTYNTDQLADLEREWLLAVIQAQQGDLAGAAQRGSAALLRYHLQGLYGPASMGQGAYAPLMFRRPSMAAELVPQFTVIPLSDTWGTRALTLAGWYAQAGDPESAGGVREQAQGDIPDLEMR